MSVSASRRPPRPERSTVRTVLVWLLCGCLALAAIKVMLDYRASRPPPVSIPVALTTILPVQAVDQLGGDGWVLFVADGWSGPVPGPDLESMCRRLGNALDLSPMQSVDVVNPAGDLVARCAAPGG